jgi:hypothetical protein
MYITRCLLLFQTREHNFLPPSAAFLHSHRRCSAHISDKSRCLQNHSPLKVLHGIAGQSGFCGASSRDCSPRTVMSSPMYCSPLVPTHRLRPSTSPPVLQQHIRLLPQQYDHSVPRSTTSNNSYNYFNNSWIDYVKQLVRPL